MSKEYKFVSAVIYLHNEQKNIKTYLKTVHSFLKKHFTKYEIICVDDASSDESVSKIHEVVENENLENVSLVSMSIYQGRELGMEAGVDLSIGDYVFELEWVDMFDVSTYEDKLWDAYCKAIEGYDVVTYSSKMNKGLSSVVFYKLYNKYNRSYTELTPERFRLVTRRAINRVSRMNKAIVYRKALYANSGLRTFVVGDRKLDEKYARKNIVQNKSKTGFSVLLAYTGLIPKIALFSEILLILLFAITVLFGIVSGFNTELSIICSVGLGMGVVVGGIGFFLIKYCELVLELILKKENYVVSSIEKLVNSEDEK